MSKREGLIHILSPVALGASIYLLFRVDTLLVFKWMEFLLLDNFIRTARNAVSGWLEYIPDFILFTVPDGLWVYAFTYALVKIWQGDRHWIKHFFMAAPVIFGAGGELGQLAGFVPGTFDIHDLWFSLLAAIIAVIYAKKMRKGG